MEKTAAPDPSPCGHVEDVQPCHGGDPDARLPPKDAGWIVARGAGVAALGLLCAAALGEGWFMALFIPVLLTAVSLWRRREGSRQQPPSRRRGRRT